LDFYRQSQQGKARGTVHTKDILLEAPVKRGALW
jgi:hypothetical protein